MGPAGQLWIPFSNRCIYLSSFKGVICPVLNNSILTIVFLLIPLGLYEVHKKANKHNYCSSMRIINI